MTKLPPEIEQALLFMKEEELRLLIDKAWERLKLFQNVRRASQMVQFNLYDNVCFDYEGEKIFGQIIRINQKTCTIIEKNNQKKWRVSPNFLQKVIEAEAEYEEKNNNDNTAYPNQQELPLDKSSQTKKISRNRPCPCGSKKKYKHCCGKN